MAFFFGVGVHTDTAHRGTAKRDIAGGVAALDASGYVIAPGKAVLLTRDATGDVNLGDRTSGNFGLKIRRIGSLDWEGYLYEGGAIKRVQTETMKDVADGIAGLDANTELNIVQMRPCIERWHNHYGVAYDFSQTVAVGNGTAVSDGTNHEMDLSTGITNAGNARFETKKTWALTTKPFIFNGILQNQVTGVGASTRTRFGLGRTLNDADPNEEMCGFLKVSGTQYARTADGTSNTSTAVTVSDGDLLTVVATSSQVQYFIDGVLQATHTTNIPTASMHVGCGVVGETGLTTAESVSVDNMEIQRYY